MPTGMLINGEWRKAGYQKDNDGRFLRNPTTFRNWITADGSSGFPAEAGRYHLYISLACPWAHRTLIMRKLKGLDDAISLSIVDPYMGKQGWQFSTAPGTIPDPIFGASYLREIYVKADPNYTGRVTVPVLWDQQSETIVNNESRELLRMFDHAFSAIAPNQTDYCPPQLKQIVDQTIDQIYEPINNGVYRAGFAQSQKAYEQAVTELFNALNHWEQVLEKQPYLCGDQITEADWCLFTTLVRFDAVYYGHFKCNLYHIFDYPNLWRYLLDLYHQPGVKETCKFDQIKQHYYQSHPHLNPSGIVPSGPVLNFDR